MKGYGVTFRGGKLDRAASRKTWRITPTTWRASRLRE